MVTNENGDTLATYQVLTLVEKREKVEEADDEEQS